MLRKHFEIPKFRNQILREFAARFDFDIFDVFEITTPLYAPREVRNFEFEGISKYWLYFRTTLSTRFSLSMEMSRLTRDGTAEPVSQDQIRRHERGQ